MSGGHSVTGAGRCGDEVVSAVLVTVSHGHRSENHQGVKVGVHNNCHLSSCHHRDGHICQGDKGVAEASVAARLWPFVRQMNSWR